MYLAPLNYDRFFKKVFKDKDISKAFLEDFLDINIVKLEILDKKKFITDDSIPVEFDYRCKLDTGENIVIEMQQWYKADIIKRFYLYHSLSTSLQLEDVGEKTVYADTRKVIKDKDYKKINPAITLIWMVDDSLGFKEDFITYKMSMENLDNFIKDELLWKKTLKEILKERKKVLDLDNNDRKDLDFISKNKLTFIFQKNIVQNNQNSEKFKKYVRWFNFALKTKNKKNIKEDFKEFKDDKLFSKIMNKLLKNRLTEEEIKYLSKEEEFKKAYIEYTSDLVEALEESVVLREDIEKLKKEKEKVQKEKEKAFENKDKERKRVDKAILRLYKLGISIDELAKDFDMNIGEVKSIVNKLKSLKLTK